MLMIITMTGLYFYITETEEPSSKAKERSFQVGSFYSTLKNKLFKKTFGMYIVYTTDETYLSVLKQAWRDSYLENKLSLFHLSGSTWCLQSFLVQRKFIKAKLLQPKSSECLFY